MTEKRLPFSKLNGLGERLRIVRKSLKRSMQDIAQEIGVSQGTISNWERGEMEPPLEYLLYALEALQAPSIDWLLTGRDCGEVASSRLPEPEVAGLLFQAREVLEAEHPVISPSLKNSIETSHWSIKQLGPEKKPGVSCEKGTPIKAKASGE